MPSRLAMLLLAALLAASSANAARMLRIADAPVSSSEANTFFQGVKDLGTTYMESAEVCMSACLANQECKAWAWCPTNQYEQPCTVDYGDLAPQDRVVPPGGCMMSGDNATNSYSVFGSRGPGVPFVSGVVSRPMTADPPSVPPPTDAGEPPAEGSGEEAFFCQDLPEAQRTCGAMAYASFKDAAPTNEWLAAYKQGAIEKYNADLAENWRRLSCTPLEGARVTCQNQWSPDGWVMVFDADCGDAGTATIEAQASVSAEGAVNYWGLVHTLCHP